VVVHDDLVEQAAVTTADVLGCDELERHAEGQKVGGVGAQLGVGHGQVEVKAPPPWWASPRGRRWLSRRRRQRSAAARGAQPVSQRALGELERLAEAGLGHARKRSEPLPGADDLSAHQVATDRQLRQQRACHRQHLACQLELALVLIVLGRRTPPARQPYEQLLEGPNGPRDQPTDPLGADAFGTGSGAQLDAQPAGAKAPDDAQGDKAQKSSWNVAQIVRFGHGHLRRGG